MLIWTAMAVVAVTVAGCTQVVKGRAVMYGPKVGQPVEWGPCRVAGGSGAPAKLPERRPVRQTRRARRLPAPRR